MKRSKPSDQTEEAVPISLSSKTADTPMSLNRLLNLEMNFSILETIWCNWMFKSMFLHKLLSRARCQAALLLLVSHEICCSALALGAFHWWAFRGVYNRLFNWRFLSILTFSSFLSLFLKCTPTGQLSNSSYLQVKGRLPATFIVKANFSAWPACRGS